MVLTIKNCKTPACFLILFFFLNTLSLVAAAETMFEGYYQIRLGGVHSGFVVQKYEFDSKKKQFSSIYYIRTNALAGNITESLRALSNDKFEPISYQYTSKMGEQVKIIDATFNGNKMVAVISDGKTGNKVEKEIPKGTFLSTFLAYMMLSRGISKGKVYSYSGIAEEDAEIYNGKALIQDDVKEAPVAAFKVLNEFKGTKFISVMSQKGEVLETKSPVQGIETRLVKSPTEATQGFQLDSKSLRLLFGNIPTGKTNELQSAGTNKATESSKSHEEKKLEVSPKATNSPRLEYKPHPKEDPEKGGK